MKRICMLLILALPIVSFAQSSTKKNAIVKKVEEKAPDGFIINGNIKGFADGTSVALLNGQTGQPEAETTISQGTFVFKGKLAAPDFKIILFNKQPPYITLFLDNSAVVVKGTKDSVESASVTGSASHNSYVELQRSLLPYQNVFDENAPYDANAVEKVKEITSNYVKNNPTSFIAPLALIRYSQVSDDNLLLEPMFTRLAGDIKNSSMGMYVTQLINDAKKNPIGSVLQDFTQNDTTGKPVSLSSLRGKYVLVDFWASWCGPCRKENPNVVANYNRFKDKNFTVLGVSLDKAKNAWVDAINMDGLSWAHVSDLQGWSNSAAQQFQIFSIPQNFLLDPDGKIVGKNLRGPALERKLTTLLK